MSQTLNFFKAYTAQTLERGTAVSTLALDRVTNLNGETLETADLTSLGRGVITVNPDADGLTTFPENIQFTGVTTATKTLTGITRGLDKEGAADTDLMHFYPIGTPVIISFGAHQIQDIIDYVNTYVTATRSVIEEAIGGESWTGKKLVYQNTSDAEWYLCDADTAATVENVRLGIAQGDGTNGGQIQGGVLTYGRETGLTGLIIGKVYASNTAGAFSSTAGTKEVTLGIALSTTVLHFQPRFDQTITENQQDLIEQMEAGTDFYAASSAGTDAYAITITPPITAYTAGQVFKFKADVANTGAATLNVSGLGAKTIKKYHDQDLDTNDIEAGQACLVMYDGTDLQLLSSVASPQSTVNVQTFTASGTWTKPSGASAVDVYMVGGGGGGGGGGYGNGASVPDYGGGGGGGGGAFAYKRFLASGLGSTEAIVVGVGGAGGNGGASPSTGGADGVAGGHSSFGTTVLLKANGGAKGEGGDANASSVAGGVGGTVLNGDIAIAGGAGGAGGSSSAGTVGVSTDVLNSPRGGGGGGHKGGGSDAAGGVGGGFTTTYVKAGGIAGASTGTDGGAGQSSPGLFFGGTGGGGGGGASTETGNGGGGVDGSGGGGGGGCRNAAGGNGGAGGDGFVIVVSYI